MIHQAGIYERNYFEHTTLFPTGLKFSLVSDDESNDYVAYC
jgi:hypothetical protein